MGSRFSRFVALAAPVVLLAACEQVKSANPLSPFIAGAIAGVFIEPPGTVSPSAGAQILYPQQPITLTISNANSNGVRPVSYVFEISIDSGFLNNQYTFKQTGVVPGADGRTSFRMPEFLPAERTYYWRAMADDGANASEYSSVATFRVITPVVIQSPVLREPGENATVSSRRPTLVVGNATRTGPAGDISYLFEVATDSAMANKVVSTLVGEGGGGETRFTVPEDLALEKRYFWRVKALDSKNQSEFTGIRSFLTPNIPVSVPTTPQAPTSGGAPVAPDMLNMGQATILNSPLDTANWPITSALKTVIIRPSGVSVEFSKKDGPGRWPDITPPGWDGALQYTLGMCLNISGKWYCSAVVQYWHGLDESGGEPWNYATNWFYDPIRWAPMTGHQPAPGETIGFYVCAGDCRNNPKGDLSPARERTNVVTLPMPGSGGGTFRF